MPSNTKAATLDVAQIMDSAGIQGANLVRELPVLAEHLEPTALALAEAAEDMEAASVEHARACESTGIRADEIYSKDLDQRHKSSDISLVRDSRLDYDQAHSVYLATRDVMTNAYRESLHEPEVLAAISLAYGAAADRLDDITARQAEIVSQLQALDGAIAASLREDLKLQGAPASTVTNDLTLDQPDRVTARARARAQALAELGDRS